MDFEKKQIEIKTPLTRARLMLNEWISGEDNEYIENALNSGIEFEIDPMTKQPKVGGSNMTDGLKEQTTRFFEKFIVSLEYKDKKGELVKITDGRQIADIIRKMPASDMKYVENAIMNLSKKDLANSAEKISNGGK